MKDEKLYGLTRAPVPLTAFIPCYNIGAPDPRFVQNRALAFYNGRATCISASIQDKAQIMYILDGSMTVEIDGESFTARTGELFCINPCEMHAAFLDENNPAVRYVYVNALTGEYLNASMPNVRHIIDGINAGTLCMRRHIATCAAAERVGRLLCGIAERMGATHDAASDFEIIGALYGIFGELTANDWIEKREQSGSDFVRHAAVFIEKHYKSEITPQMIYDEFSYNPSYFSRLFSARFGKPFRTYLNEFRILRALVLLTKGQLSVQEAARHVGFTDYGYFSQVFRRVTGMSAGEYARLYRK